MNGNPAILRGFKEIKMSGKMVLKAGILGLCFFSVLACQKPMIPQYLGLTNLQLNKVDAGKTLISANVKFYNSNGFKLRLKRADMDIFLNEKPVDHYVLDSTIFIPARDTFYIPVALNADLQHIFSNAIQVFLANTVKITLDGKVKLKKGIFSFKRHVHYEVNQPLSSLLQGEN
jgi:LEA14-like dessication related protein